MELFLNKDPSDNSIAWPELLIQAYIIQQARRDGWLVAGDQNAGKRNPGTAAASGILAGAPDMRFFCPGGWLMQIELKTVKGKLSPVQKTILAQMSALGFVVHVVYADCPASGWKQVHDLLSSSQLRNNA